MNEPIYLVIKQLEEISKINNDLNSVERLDLFKKVLKSLLAVTFITLRGTFSKNRTKLKIGKKIIFDFHFFRIPHS